MPSLECKTRRVGGANYQVPWRPGPARRETLGLRWLTAFAAAPVVRRPWPSAWLLRSWMSPTTPATPKKREDTHKMAEANKAFAHFRY